MVFPKFVSFCIQKMLEFRVVGELSCWGHKLAIDVPNFVPFCYWKGAKFAEKNIHILGNFEVRR